MRVLIIGRTEILYETVRMLSSKHTICGILTAPAVPEYARTEHDFEKLAGELGCPFLCTKTLNQQALKFISQAEPEIAVSTNWVSVIDQHVTSLFSHGILNAHHGDLPRYRGNAAINWAIIKHEPQIPLNVHQMEPGELDAGDIFVRRWLTLTETTTIKNILDFMEQNIPTMFLESLDGLENGTIAPIKQSETGQTPSRCYPRLPVYSKIDWKQPARDIDAIIRASTRPYSGAYSYLKVEKRIKKVYIWRSRVVSDETNDIGIPGHIIKNDKVSGESWVFTGQGILAIGLVQYESEREFEPGKTWKSIRMRFGVDVEAELIALYNELTSIITAQSSCDEVG